MSRLAPRGALVALLALASLAGASSATAAGGWTKAVRSEPGLRIPKVTVTAHDDGVAPGFIFTTPRTIYPGRTGPTILDKNGHVVWFHMQSHRLSAQDLRPQTLNGKPVLTWSLSPPLLHEGQVLTRHSTAHNNYDVIADSSYRIVKRVRAKGRGVITDGHEFLISRRNTALVLGDRPLTRRLARYGGPARGQIVDDVVQEIDLRTNRVLFSWSAAAHIPLSESMTRPPSSGRWDPFHLNSISEDSDGNLLVSARHTSTIYKIGRRSGGIVWKLGGRHSSFRLGSGVAFYYQHDALRQADGTITLFDNHKTEFDSSHGHESYGKQIRLDMKSMKATLVRRFYHPAGHQAATSQGNTSILPNGDAFIGWGISPWFSEYAADGRLLFGAHFTSVWHHSYRAFKGVWSARPPGVPAVYARTGAGGQIAVYVSWNGATDVAQWRVLGGVDQDTLVPLVTQPWADFETKLTAHATPALVQVQALDAAGNVLGTSAAVKPKGA